MPMTRTVTPHKTRIAAVVFAAAFAVGLPMSGRPGGNPAHSEDAAVAQAAAPWTRCGRIEPTIASLQSHGFLAQAAKNFALLARADCLAGSGRYRG
jgi:hypothetical protein